MKKMLFLMCLVFCFSAFAQSQQSNQTEMIHGLTKNNKASHAKRYKKQEHLMNSETFGFFISELKNTWPDNQKYKIYLKYLLKYDLTVNQLVKISSLVTFDKDKIETISLLYPCVIDKENTIELISTVYNKEALIKILKQK